MLRRLACIVLVILLTSVAITTNLIHPVWAQTSEMSVINPNTGDNNFTFYTNTTSVGTRFNATIWIYNVTDLFAYQVMMQIDDALLNITRAWLPTWDPNWVCYGQPTFPPAPAFYDIDDDGVNEAALVGVTMLSGATPFTGNGTLAIFEFEIIYAPTKGTETTPLNINNEDTFWKKFIAEGEPLEKIFPQRTDGYYSYIGPAVPAAIIYVDPARIDNASLGPSSNFSVNVRIGNSTDVYGFEFKLGYDPTVLNIINVTAGDFFPPDRLNSAVNNTSGVLIVTAALISPELPRSGDGLLVTIMFHVEGIGVSDFDLFDTKLSDETGYLLPHTSEDGFFKNVLARLYVEPEELIDPALMPGHIFSVDIVIDDVENLYGYEFWLAYNTQMLTCIGILIHPILDETNFSTDMTVDDSSGLIWVRVSYYQPATPIKINASQSAVTLTFMVDKIGSSVLDLYDTILVDPDQQPIPHEAIDGFVMTLIRDVAVTNVIANPSWVYEGWLVNITVTVKNLGNNVTETFDVKVFYNDSEIDSQTVKDLPPNGEMSLPFVWNTSDVAEGVYTIKGEAAQVPDEFDITNNIFVDGTVQVETLIRDIAITNVTVFPTAVYPGWPVNVTVTARNEGNLSQTFNVIAYYNSNIIDELTVLDLEPNKEITLVFVWNTTGLPECSNYTISAEAVPVQFEIDLADNIFIDGYVKIKLTGDITGDGKVNVEDLSIVGLAFGSYPGHPRWNPEADLNRDDKVNIEDLALVAANFGRVC